MAAGWVQELEVALVVAVVVVLIRKLLLLDTMATLVVMEPEVEVAAFGLLAQVPEALEDMDQVMAPQAPQALSLSLSGKG